MTGPPTDCTTLHHASQKAGIQSRNHQDIRSLRDPRHSFVFPQHREHRGDAG